MNTMFIIILSTSGRQLAGILVLIQMLPIQMR